MPNSSLYTVINKPVCFRKTKLVVLKEEVFYVSPVGERRRDKKVSVLLFEYQIFRSVV